MWSIPTVCTGSEQIEKEEGSWLTHNYTMSSKTSHLWLVITLTLVPLHYLTKWGNTKIAFFTQMLYQCTSRCLISSIFLTHTLLYDSLNLVINAFSSGLLGGMIQEKGSRER